MRADIITKLTANLPRSRPFASILFGVTTALVLAAGFIVYQPGLSGAFDFDDFPNIVSNQHLQMSALTLHQLLAAAFSSHAGPLYRPIAMASFALNRYFTGLDPYWFKLTNVLIHLGCGALMIVFSRLLLSSYRGRRAPWLSAARVQWVALLVAAAWIVHPLNLTAVLYVVQRMVSLASLFMLGAMCLYVLGRQRQLAGRSGWALIWLGTPLVAALGLFTKEIGVLVPLYLVVVEGVVFRFRNARGTLDRPIAAYFLFGLAIPVALAIGWEAWHLSGVIHSFDGRPFTLTERLMSEARVMMLCVKWTLIPNIKALSLYHDDFAVSTGLLTPPMTLISLIGMAALFAAAWLLRRRAPLATLGILWFFAGHALESTIIPLELIHEHRNYLADYGILLAVISLLLLPRAPAYKLLRLGGAVGLVFAGLLAGVTYTRASQWGNNVTQAYYEAAHHPASPRATYAYGSVLADLVMRGNTQYADEAYKALEQARQVSPDNVMPDAALIIMTASLHRPIRPEWVADAAHRLHDYKPTPEAVDSLARLEECEQQDCKLSKAQMMHLFDAALSNPHISRHGQRYADTLTIKINYMTHQRAPLARLIDMMRRVVAAQPETPQYRINLANALIVAGDIEGAEGQIQALRKLNTIGELDRAINDLKDQIAKRQAAPPKAQHKANAAPPAPRSRG